MSRNASIYHYSASVDWLLIGGGLSFLLLPLLLWSPHWLPSLDSSSMILLSTCVNSTHFAASSVRLYSHTNHAKRSVLIYYLLPGLFLALALLGISSPNFGRHIVSAYLTWSPFHYCAQTFGLCLIYLSRQDVILDRKEKELFWWLCLLPFLWAFTQAAHSNAGLGWLLGDSKLPSALTYMLSLLGYIIAIACFLSPLLVAFRTKSRSGKFPPAIVWCLILSNTVWWIGFNYLQAFAWATIAHGAQYLAIVLLYHAKDKGIEQTPNRQFLSQSLLFYCQSLTLAYILFRVWPYCWQWLGYGYANAVVILVALINIHHFIVDDFLWSRRGSRTWGLFFRTTKASAV